MTVEYIEDLDCDNRDPIEDHDLDEGVTIGWITTCHCRKCGAPFEFGVCDD